MIRTLLTLLFTTIALLLGTQAQALPIPTSSQLVFPGNKFFVKPFPGCGLNNCLSMDSPEGAEQYFIQGNTVYILNAYGTKLRIYRNDRLIHLVPIAPPSDPLDADPVDIDTNILVYKKTVLYVVSKGGLLEKVQLPSGKLLAKSGQHVSSGPPATVGGPSHSLFRLKKLVVVKNISENDGPGYTVTLRCFKMDHLHILPCPAFLEKMKKDFAYLPDGEYVTQAPGQSDYTKHSSNGAPNGRLVLPYLYLVHGPDWGLEQFTRQGAYVSKGLPNHRRDVYFVPWGKVPMQSR